MCADAGLSIEQTAKALHVTTRTVRYWISGRVGIPYAAYRLVRILGRYELPDPAWAGWIMHSGRLWSPEGHGFVPGDSSWWGLLVAQARLWREQYERGRQCAMRKSAGPRGSPLAGEGVRPALPQRASVTQHVCLTDETKTAFRYNSVTDSACESGRGSGGQHAPQVQGTSRNVPVEKAQSGPSAPALTPLAAPQPTRPVLGGKAPSLWLRGAPCSVLRGAPCAP
jgi:Phage protein